MKISGCEQVISALRSIGDASHIEHALLLSAEAAANAARSLCPVDTGKLRDSISAQASGNTAVISASAPYAAYVELGTYKSGAQPYLVPSLTAAESSIIEALSGAITK